MILSYLSSGYSLKEVLPIILLSIPIVLISMTVHEFSHGWMSYKLGDPTANQKGRLTLNPLAHLDPLGTLCMFLLGFGWAKPVPINAGYYKKPKLGVALTALAGPLSNFILGFLAVLCNRIFYVLVYSNAAGISATASPFVINLIYYFSLFLYMSVFMNIGLAVFNLLPIPPLDGSRLMFSFLPDKLYFGYMKYERYIYYALLILILAGNVFGYSLFSGFISFIVDKVIYGFEFVVRLIPGLG